MSSSGKGQMILHSNEDIDSAWVYAHENCRGGCDRVIIEKFIKFDYEVTIMTVRHRDSDGNSRRFLSTYCTSQKEGDFQDPGKPII